MLEIRIQKFWAEVVNAASYISNRSPAIVVKHKTLKEAWSGRKPTVGHFKVFSYDAYVHIPDEKKKKLDKKIHKCIIVGCSQSSRRPTCCMIMIQMEFLLREM